jgi:uncharacterized damage-inducible protein DinB
MKKVTTSLLITLLSMSSYNSIAQQKTTMTNQERNYAVQFLKATEAGVLNAVNGLSDAQLKFKPAADKWSVEDCVKHIAAAERELWAMATPALQQPANPAKRADIKFSDDALVKAVEDRTQKSKTFAALEPVNSPYKTSSEALNAFKESRAKLISFVKSNEQDLRNHVLVLPVGTYDVYQFVLLIAAHTNRHTQQIEEVKANAGFPKQ